MYSINTHTNSPLARAALVATGSTRSARSTRPANQYPPRRSASPARTQAKSAQRPTSLAGLCQTTNSIGLSHLCLILITLLFFGSAGIGFVFLKNKQHVLGEEVRSVERSIREYHARNQALESLITRKTSRHALRQRLEIGSIALVPIQDQAIARLTPAVASPINDGVLRTASNQTTLQNHP